MTGQTSIQTHLSSNATPLLRTKESSKNRRYPRFVFEMSGPHLMPKFPCCIVTERASHYFFKHFREP